MEHLSRTLLVLAGLIGAVGVAAAAGATHADSHNLSAIATIFLAHAPVFLVVALNGRGRVLLWSTGLLALGTLVFGADLGLREWLGQPAFAGAAPLGGAAMILGWLGLAAAGLARRVSA
jgi:uncharacterized membrane protein YgdD (TMEM256/DUF423 family)